MNYASVTEVVVSYPTTPDTSKDEGPTIIISLSMPPLLGRESVHPSAVDGQVLEPTVSFTLVREDVARFFEALKSRGFAGQCGSSLGGGTNAVCREIQGVGFIEAMNFLRSSSAMVAFMPPSGMMNTFCHSSQKQRPASDGILTCT